MKATNLILLTIIAEDELESRLIADLKALGVRGDTICSVRGEGCHGLRASQWEGENIKIDWKPVTITNYQPMERKY